MPILKYYLSIVIDGITWIDNDFKIEEPLNLSESGYDLGSRGRAYLKLKLKLKLKLSEPESCVGVGVRSLVQLKWVEHQFGNYLRKFIYLSECMAMETIEFRQEVHIV